MILRLFRPSRGLLGSLALWGIALGPTLAAADGFRVERVVAGLDQPISVVQAPGEPHSLYIVESRTDDFSGLTNRGQVVKYDMLTNTKSTFLAIDGITTSIDGGVHSLAFHPNYENNGKFYVAWIQEETTPGDFKPHLRVDEFQNSGGGPELTRTLLDLKHLGNNSSHSLNWIGFKPGVTGDAQDYLYITTGDGGILPDEPGYTNLAQDLSSLRGKVLRVDVGGEDDYPFETERNYAIPDSNPYANDTDPVSIGEVYHSGLRNPWRMSFDRLTGDMYIGDVGNSSKEEINFAPNNIGGIDYGWSRREGTIQTPVFGLGGPQGNSLNPIWQFDHATTGNVSITGGYMYRGPVEELEGTYFFADAYQERIFSGEFSAPTLPSSYNGANLTEFQERRAELTALIPGGGVIDSPVSFGEDAFGHLYIVDFGSNSLFASNMNVGEIFRIVPDIDGDYNLNGVVDAADYTIWRDTLGSHVDLRANGDNSGASIGVVDEADFLYWRARFGDTFGSGAAAGEAASAAVPEPTSAFLALCSALVAFASRRR